MEFACAKCKKQVLLIEQSVSIIKGSCIARFRYVASSSATIALPSKVPEADAEEHCYQTQ